MKVRKSRLGLRELSVSNRPWTEEAARRYRDEGCAAVSYTALDRGFTVPDVGFLRELPGLREVRLLGSFEDDTAVAGIDTLEVLWLQTGSQRALDLRGLPRLRDLLVSWARPVDGVDGLALLRELEVHDFRGSSLRWLGAKPELRFLRIDTSRRHRFDVSGIEGCTGLERLWVNGGTIEGSRAFAALVRLRELALHGAKVPDLSFVSALPALAELELESVGSLASLQPLRGHPGLRSVAITGSTTVEDGDLSPLTTMPRLVSAPIGTAKAHYRPTAREINERFPPIAGPVPWE